MINVEITIRNPQKLTEGFILGTSADYKYLWITKLNGEGAQFSVDSIYQLIDKFYNKNF